MRLAGAILVCLLAAAPAAVAAADDVVVQAIAGAAKIGESDTLTLSVEVRAGSLPPVEEPDLAGLADFTLASGPNVSTSTSMFWNGGSAQASSTKRFVYELLPKRRGTLTVPSIPVRVGGRTLRTQAVTIEVVQGSVGQAAPPSPFQRGPFDPRGGQRQEAAAGDVFIEATLGAREVYVGQQVLLVYRIYTQLDLAALPQPKQLPAYTGFWVEEIPVDPRATIRRTVVRGKEYAEITLMKKALFPAKSGEMKIDETLFEVQVRSASDDPFDRFFNTARALYRRTPALSLKVLPLPEAGRPASFQGAVGKFSLGVSADRTEAQINDAIGLTVKVVGDGNLRTAGEPLLPDLPDYRRFDPKTEDERTVKEDRILGTRTWSYVLVPLAAGEKTIPPVRFAYFDPEARSYRELAGPPQNIRVARGTGTPAGGDAGAVRRDVVAVRKDIRYIKPASSLRSAGGIRTTGWFYVLIAAPLVANAALYAHLRRREHLAANVGMFRRRRASRAARSRLKQARLMMKGADRAACFAEVDRAVTGYLADKFTESAAGLTRERIAALLEERRVPEDLRRRTSACLERCDFGRFAATSPGGEQAAALVSQAEDVITALERALG